MQPETSGQSSSAPEFGPLPFQFEVIELRERRNEGKGRHVGKLEADQLVSESARTNTKEVNSWQQH